MISRRTHRSEDDCSDACNVGNGAPDARNHLCALHQPAAHQGAAVPGPQGHLPPAADPDLAPAALTPARHRGVYTRGLERMADRTAAAAAELLALAAPVDCVCCGAEDAVLCGVCERQVRQLTLNPFRAEGQAPALMDMDGSVILPVVAAGVYRRELAQSVLSFKSHGQGQLGEVLAKGLARALRAALGQAEGLCLVPVPTSNSAFRKRGFSPVHLLLKRLSRREFPGLTIVGALRKATPLAEGGTFARAPFLGRLPALRQDPGAASGMQSRLPGGQKGLGRGARAQRVRGSMRVRAGLRSPDITGRPCLLVDDVLTTGATLAEAARALREAGALVLGAVVLAATRPPVGSDFGSADRPEAWEGGHE
ncbi:MAG: ComF family protein [Arthrobacter sp.]|nr:ComF family protein [Arthrobacter sp.]